MDCGHVHGEHAQHQGAHSPLFTLSRVHEPLEHVVLRSKLVRRHEYIRQMQHTGFPSHSSPGSCWRRFSMIGRRCLSPRRILLGTLVKRRPATLPTKAKIIVMTLTAEWCLRLQEAWEEVDNLGSRKHINGELLVEGAIIFVAACRSVNDNRSLWAHTHRGRPENNLLLVRHTMSITDQ